MSNYFSQELLLGSQQLPGFGGGLAGRVGGDELFEGLFRRYHQLQLALASGDVEHHFRSPGRGDIDFEQIIVALNDVGYTGPLSVEWEDSRMNREHGAKEACQFVRQLDFESSAIAFDGQFEKK